MLLKIAGGIDASANVNKSSPTPKLFPYVINCTKSPIFLIECEYLKGVLLGSPGSPGAIMLEILAMSGENQRLQLCN